jgi:hypothetical protein
MKFSLYEEGGIEQTKPNRCITLEELFLMVRNNPNVGFYENLRNLRITDREQYDKLKKTLPFITPHVETNGRRLSSDYFDINFRSFSNLMYFDMDNVEDILNVKQRIIKQYGDFVSFVCISPSGKGISIIIQIENEITKDNFEMIWYSIRLNELKDEKIDSKATGIGRPMFISYDPDVYFNPSATLAVDFTMDEKVGKHYNSVEVFDTINVNSHISNINTITKRKYKIYEVNEILQVLNTCTPVHVDNEIVDVKEVDYISMYIPRNICQGKRHSTFYRMIHSLFYLNPIIEIDYIYSYMWLINNCFTTPRLDKEELHRHFNSVVDQIHRTQFVYINLEKRRIHWNRNFQFNKTINKGTLANRLVGLYTRSKNQNSVFEAIDRLGAEGKKITNKAIKEITGKDIKTIRNYRDKPLIDMEVEIKIILDEMIPNNLYKICA